MCINFLENEKLRLLKWVARFGVQIRKCDQFAGTWSWNEIYTSAVQIIVGIYVEHNQLYTTMKAGFPWDNNKRNRLICQHVNSPSNYDISTCVCYCCIKTGRSKWGERLGVGVFVFQIIELSVISVRIYRSPQTSIYAFWTASWISKESTHIRKYNETEYATTTKTILQLGVIARVQKARDRTIVSLSPQCNYPSVLL